MYPIAEMNDQPTAKPQRSAKSLRFPRLCGFFYLVSLLPNYILHFEVTIKQNKLIISVLSIIG